MEKHGPRRGFHGHSGGPCRPMKTPLLRRPVIWAPGYSPCRHREGILGSASAVSPPKQVSAIRRDRQGTTRPMSSGWHRQWCPDEGYLAEVENAVILRGSPLVTVRQTAGGSPMAKVKRLALRLGRYLTEEKGTASRGTIPCPGFCSCSFFSCRPFLLFYLRPRPSPQMPPVAIPHPEPCRRACRWGRA